MAGETGSRPGFLCPGLSAARGAGGRKGARWPGTGNAGRVPGHAIPPATGSVVLVPPRKDTLCLPSHSVGGSLPPDPRFSEFHAKPLHFRTRVLEPGGFLTIQGNRTIIRGENPAKTGLF